MPPIPVSHSRPLTAVVEHVPDPEVLLVFDTDLHPPAHVSIVADEDLPNCQHRRRVPSPSLESSDIQVVGFMTVHDPVVKTEQSDEVLPPENPGKGKNRASADSADSDTDTGGGSSRGATPPAKSALIPRPKAAMRLHLTQTTDLDSDLVAEIYEFVRALVDKEFTLDKPLGEQKPDKVAKVTAIVLDKYEVLKKYADAWPVRRLYTAALDSLRRPKAKAKK